ncbi:antitoxin VapB family protein [Methanothrix harundinacea]|nr:antitoxin VapB family protein [Methanothrix harundinacea]
MGTRTLSIREETYEMLKREKREGESFSDVIDRLMRR